MAAVKGRRVVPCGEAVAGEEVHAARMTVNRAVVWHVPRPGELQMHLLPKQPTGKAPADRFTGDAYIDVIVQGQEPSRVRVSVVRFAPGARNAWHVHAVGQVVHVTDGEGRIQARGGEVLEMRAGDTVQTRRGSGTGTAPPQTGS
jgi:quercetin dioxygenase-like cupin family protein